MYRHSGALNMGAQPFAFLPSPTQEDQSASESESETIAQLDRKRRQLDEEIARFKIEKEKEFRDFEQDLRRKRKRKRSPANGENHNTRAPPTHPSVLSLLGSRPQANGHAHKQNQQQASRPQPVPSKPTLSVEKLTIVGTTAPPAPAAADAPPSALARSLSGTTTPPRTQKETTSVLPPTPTIQSNIKNEAPPTPVARDHNDPFAGVFTPSYLPLLDSRSSSSRSVPHIQTNSTELSQSDPNPQTPQPGSESSSLPSSPTSPRIPKPAKRTHTAPLLPSTSLPSALRVASGDSASTRKRKHVMFRLADSAVVEPSSSYEEMSSPDLPLQSSSGTANNGKAKSNGIDSVLASEEVPWSWNKGLVSPIVEKDNMNIVGDGEAEDEPLNVTMTEGTPATQTSTNEPITAPGGLQFDEAPDGGSGVGFFELEEELDSPSPGISTRVRSPRSDRDRFFDDWGAIPDEEEEMEMAEDQRIAEAHGVETHTTEEDLAEEMRENGDDEANPQGLGISATGRHEGHASAFASGSVPIDIVVRPSSSWIGSFGAGSQTKESNYVP